MNVVCGVIGTLKFDPGGYGELSSGVGSKVQVASGGGTGARGIGERVSERIVKVMSVFGVEVCFVTVERISRGPAESRS